MKNKFKNYYQQLLKKQEKNIAIKIQENIKYFYIKTFDQIIQIQVVFEYKINQKIQQ